jgi:2,4-dienoyl-CoA reductase-like NADH-dependent reductase (Old Yellow Enzyme family)
MCLIKMSSPLLFTPLKLHSITLKNRVVMSPMCQYSARDGHLTDWHYLHYATRAIGGVGLIMVEATAVEACGVISPEDVGIWSDDHIAGLQTVTRAITQHGAVAGIQIAHAGRKAGTSSPWNGGQPLHTFTPVAPSSLAFADGYETPTALSETELAKVRDAFQAGARRALEAGFGILEIHMAHGYLLHSFLSPISNTRTDHYGGSLENRMRFPLEVTQAIREVWPLELPLFVRVSATDWLEGGWSLDDTLKFATELAKLQVDLLDCSSSGIISGVTIPIKPGYQVPLAAEVKQKTPLKTGAVGLITQPEQAEEILQKGYADLIFLGRPLLSDPYWTYRADQVLQAKSHVYPVQYQRAFS